MKKRLFTTILIAMVLTGCTTAKTATPEGNVIDLDNISSTVNITSGGTYEITGSCGDGSIIIEADKDDVTLVLKDIDLTSSSSAPICVLSAGKVSIRLEGGNKLMNGGSFTNIGTEEVDAVIYSKSDLVIGGDGKLEISSPAGHGIVCKDNMEITGGSYDIDASEDGINTNDSLTIDAENIKIRSGDDALHTDGTLKYINGTSDITAAEGLEGTVVTIEDGNITIEASDDGINAAAKSDDLSPLIEINGGNIDITMGAGDTDGLDSNGDIKINGGTISINGQSTIDYDGTATKSGGTLIINGEETDTIPDQMMGRGGPMEQGGRFPDGGSPEGEFPKGGEGRRNEEGFPGGGKGRPMDFEA